jgi:phosphatidylinositol alpha 1,6-mannosyltransferase
VAAASGGPLDLISHGVSGLLYDADDPGAMRRAVATAVGDEALRAQLAIGGRARVENRSWANAVDQLIVQHYGPVAGADVGEPRRTAA